MKLQETLEHLNFMQLYIEIGRAHVSSISSALSSRSSLLVLDLFAKTKTNIEFVQTVRKMRYL